ncbi:receptor-like protein kinase FERONIA [Carya illinoinensis]|uniref:receptor-like protein kinase FERONIA n=1 Tax=Carya illinoinensis TaxID=32201 RepID=UPI001C722792|nr:receptor-like protein kinase FERONIA [Carya illinoinensis]
MATALTKLRKRLGFSGKARASSLPGELCRDFFLDEIKTATHDFNKELIVGEGGFGTVYEGFIDKGNSWPVAIKRLNKDSLQGEAEFSTETLLLCQIRHVHLIPFIGYCKDEGERILVYGFMANKSLGDQLYGTDKIPLPWKQRLQICIGAARGLHCLHTGLKHPVIHRDVKPTNILLDENWVAKVSDFGLSRQVLNDIKSSNLVGDVERTRGPLDFELSEQISSNSTTASYNGDLSGYSTLVAGTLGYADPEYLRSGRVTTKSDVYSFGVVLLEVLCARRSLNTKLEEEQRYLADWARKCNENGSIENIIDPYLKGKIDPECFKVYVEIAVTCVQDKGIQRPTIVDVMEKLELALELQEKADSEREKMISAGSNIMEDLSANSQTQPT